MKDISVIETLSSCHKKKKEKKSASCLHLVVANQQEDIAHNDRYHRSGSRANRRSIDFVMHNTRRRSS